LIHKEVVVLNRQRDENLMVVTAVEGYSFEHGINEKDVFDMFSRHNVFNLLRCMTTPPCGHPSTEGNKSEASLKFPSVEGWRVAPGW
jgi:hypothetical protein